MYLLYDLMLLLSAGFLIPYYLLRGLRQGKVRRGIRERLGFYTAEQLAAVVGKKVIWVHAVSVGETMAAVPLLKALKQNYPDHVLLLSNVTETGHQIAKGLRGLDLCLFFPFDLSWVVHRVLNQVKPVAIIIVETEIWPNFIRRAKALEIPVTLVNGRISDRSFPRYRLARPLLTPLLDHFTAFCMQTELDARRVIEMGARAEKVEVTGNLKFDMQADILESDELERQRGEFRVPAQVPVWVAGSTHAGEEETVVGVYRELIDAGEEVFLILVPRHPERCRQLFEQFTAQGLTVTLRSGVHSREESLPSGAILLVDTIGEMLKFYALADLVFVGGSLVPVGGHNVLEASLLKKPVLFGTYMHNFKEISRLLQEVGGGAMIDDGPSLLAKVRQLLEHPDQRRAMGGAGWQLLQIHAGATARTLASVVQRIN